MDLLNWRSITFFLYFIYALCVIVVTVKIVLDNRHPQVAIAWLLAIYFIPYVGVIVYIFAGVNWKSKKIVKNRPEEFFGVQLKSILERQRHYLQQHRSDKDNDVMKVITLLLNSSNSIITLNNSVRAYFGGNRLFPRMLADLAAARSSIHMEFFIWKSDALGNKILEILVERARAGIEIRLIFDGVGSFARISREYKRRLQRAGIEFRTFLDPKNPLFGRLINYRNHRKIVVIDGEIGYTGGMNIGDEYITGGKRFACWRDTHMRLRGESVRLLQGVFLIEWHNSGAGLLRDRKYFPGVPSDGSQQPEFAGRRLPVQVICSGPDSTWDSLKLLFFTLISNANEEVLIQSPYFIPDESIQSAMETAALGGVRVRFMMTGVPDKRIAYWAAQTYFQRMLKAGVEILLYQAGFFHPKMIVVDGRMATVGTANLDIRSLQLHYELNLVVYDRDSARQLRQQFDRDAGQCRKIAAADIAEQSTAVRLRNSISRMFAPLL